jgi:hypothetical protein
MAEAKKPQVDWEAIEGDYRAGVLSTREIAVAHGISHTAINKRAKAESWDRDLSAKIKAKADALVSRRAVSSEVSTARAATERQIIEANAERVAQVKGEHRGTAARLNTLGLTLLAELETQSADVEALAKLGELMLSPDEKGRDKLNELYQKVISTPSRIDSAKKVAETLRHAIGLEREAYGLDDKKGGDEPPGEISIRF